jgi:hypothetical protein
MINDDHELDGLGASQGVPFAYERAISFFQQIKSLIRSCGRNWSLRAERRWLEAISFER